MTKKLFNPWYIILLILFVNILGWVIYSQTRTTDTDLQSATELVYIGQYDTALDNIDILLRSDSSNPQLMAERCSILLKTDKLTQATDCLAKLTKLSTNPQYLQLYKTLLVMREDDYDAAQVYVDSMIATAQPTDEMVYQLAGMVAYERGDMEQATQHLDTALQLDINNPTALYYRGLIAQRANDHVSAISYFDQAETAGIADVSLWSAKVISLNKRGRSQDAIRYADQILLIDSENTHAMLQKSIALTNLQDYQQSLILLDSVIQNDSSNYEALRYKGDVLREQSVNEESLNIYDQSLNIMSGGSNLESYVGKLLIYGKLKDVSKIEFMLNELDGVTERYGRGNVVIARTLGQIGFFDDTQKYLDRAFALVPEYGPAYDERLNILIRQSLASNQSGQYLQADKTLNEAATLRDGAYSGNTNLTYARGLTALLASNRPAATQHFTTLWGDKYQASDLDTILTLWHIWQGDYDQATDLISQIAVHYPDTQYPLWLKTYLLMTMDDRGVLDKTKDYYVAPDQTRYNDPGIPEAATQGLSRYNDFFTRYLQF